MGCHEKFCYIRTCDGRKYYYGVVIRKLLYNVTIATLYIEASYCSRSLESDATVRADYALATTTTLPPVFTGRKALKATDEVEK